MKPTAQEARQIANDAIRWAYLNHESIAIGAASIKDYLTRFDAHIAGDGELICNRCGKPPKGAKGLGDHCGQYFDEVKKGWFCSGTIIKSPAPQNAAGDNTEAIDFAEWLAENTEIIREPKITLYRYCDNFNEWGNYTLADIYTVFKEKYEPDAAGDNWISVEEPPKESGNYIVWDENTFGKDKRELYRYDKETDNWFWGADCFHPQKWQHLPSPPTATQNDNS